MIKNSSKTNNDAQMQKNCPKKKKKRGCRVTDNINIYIA